MQLKAVMFCLFAIATGIVGATPSRDALPLAGKWGALPKEWGKSNVVWRTFKSTVPFDTDLNRMVWRTETGWSE